MSSPQQRISPSKESRSRQIRNPKTQENQDLPTAFLQNRILAHVKSQRRINRFRILHRRRYTRAISRRCTPMFLSSQCSGLIVELRKAAVELRNASLKRSKNLIP